MAGIELPYQDHHEVALQRGEQRLRERWDASRLKRLGAEAVGEGRLELQCLAWRFAVQLDPFAVTVLPEGREPSVVWRILVLDYLAAENPRPPVSFVSFADFAEGRGYLKAFDGRVVRRLQHSVGAQIDSFADAAERCGGVQGNAEPLAYLFRFFPRFELQALRYEGDEDFSPSCNVLFSDNALSVLSIESVIVAADELVTCMKKGKGP